MGADIKKERKEKRLLRVVLSTSVLKEGPRRSFSDSLGSIRITARDIWLYLLRCRRIFSRRSMSFHV